MRETRTDELIVGFFINFSIPLSRIKINYYDRIICIDWSCCFGRILRQLAFTTDW